jgi:anti-sigma B factor antagonist
MRSQTRATLRDDSPLTIIDLEGEVTTFSQQPIEVAYEQACENGARDILLNFRNVAYLNSAGIAVVIELLTKARQRDQSIFVTGLSDHYVKVFKYTGLEPYVRMCDTEEQAKSAAAREVVPGRDHPS